MPITTTIQLGRGRRHNIVGRAFPTIARGSYDDFSANRLPQPCYARKMIRKVAERTVAAKSLLFLLLGLILAGCGNDGGKSWREEVRMLDGRVFIVEQKRRLQTGDSGQGPGTVGREGWLRFPNPDRPSQYIEWHEKLQPLVLNSYSGVIYIVAIPFTDTEWRLYGKPIPRYLSFRLRSDGNWERIRFTEIPKEIYETNLLIRTVPEDRTEIVKTSFKDDQLKNPGYISELKHINPKYR